MTTIAAGKLRHYVDVRIFDPNKLDKHGQPSREWITTFKAWVGIEPLSGTELETAMRIDTRIKYKIEARYDSRLSAQGQIQFGDRIFNIVSLLNEDERNRHVFLGCEEINNGN